MNTDRVILHVDMDAFFASVEQRDHPEWRGRPVVVGASPDQRGVVAAASYEAREYGIRSAMPSREAGRRCPHAIFVPPNGQRYQEASQHVFRLLERYSPHVEPLSIDEAFLDVTGSQRLFGPGERIGQLIREAIKTEIGLPASVGVAPNKFLAKLAGELAKPDGLLRAPWTASEIAAFLAPLPVGRLWGVGAVLRGHLEQAGWHTISDIQTVSETQLGLKVGKHTAQHLKALSFGQDSREVEPPRDAKSISREHTFDTDCGNPEILHSTLLALTADVARRLRAAGAYATQARIKVRWSDFRTLTRQKTLPEPVRDDHSLRAAAESLWNAISVQRPVRLIGFGVGNLVEKPVEQMHLFDTASDSRARNEALSRTLDAIRARHGPNGLRPASQLAPSTPR